MVFAAFIAGTGVIGVAGLAAAARITGAGPLFMAGVSPGCSAGGEGGMDGESDRGGCGGGDAFGTDNFVASDISWPAPTWPDGAVGDGTERDVLTFWTPIRFMRASMSVTSFAFVSVSDFKGGAPLSVPFFAARIFFRNPCSSSSSSFIVA